MATKHQKPTIEAAEIKIDRRQLIEHVEESIQNDLINPIVRIHKQTGKADVMHNPTKDLRHHIKIPVQFFIEDAGCDIDSIPERNTDDYREFAEIWKNSIRFVDEINTPTIDRQIPIRYLCGCDDPDPIKVGAIDRAGNLEYRSECRECGCDLE